ncbi:S8 family serine peptidase [Phreatobacter oligotrophus]|uniref:Subtilisin family serine protease n=1 Tax=Phreatobacter oligotrophus TaxID=1122261 RepID=A0A2T4YYD7_9HYPH|nr:S8 family serine peptidase [Phreatobacter oligotrophus]PTM51498.1 subtilisin family serine protease [Phreatobacter oligotrophus]
MADDESGLRSLSAASLIRLPAHGKDQSARLIIGADKGADALAAAARVAERLAEFQPVARLLSPLSTDVAVITLPGFGFSHDLAAVFDFAEALSRATGVAMIEPEFAYAPNIDEETKPGAAIPEGAFAVPGCWVGEDPALDGDTAWAPAMIRAPQAWAFSKDGGRPAAGKGVIIAHLDTGLTDHPELAGATLLSGLDLIDGDAMPQDPLDPSSGNPGHGTSTASVIVSQAKGKVTGSAPAASLLPVRCISSVIVVFASRIAEAIDHAVARGAHVITMSLGGLSSFSLERALARAVAADVIVLAAAGNCVKVVVYPAADPNCIAIGGVNAKSEPWRGSCRGPEVDICAPAENVFRAKAEPGGSGGSSQGEGTSYAVALMAGATACWLAHHGRARAIAAARSKGLSLQELFRRAVRDTARQPADWDAMLFGAGILNMEALLRLDLDAMPTREGGAGVSSAPTGEGRVRNLLLSLAEEPSEALAAAQIHAVQTEIIAQVMLRRTGDAQRTASRRLTEAISAEGVAALSLSACSSDAPAAPSLKPLALSADTRADAMLRHLRKRLVAKVAGLEAAELENVPDDAPLPPFEDALAAFDPANVDAFIARFPKGEVACPDDIKRALGIIWRQAKPAYGKLNSPGGISQASAGDKAALEAVVNFDGSSPSLLLRQSQVDIAHPLAGAWAESLFLANSGLLRDVAPAIGRIQRLDGGPAAFFGTGSLVAGAKKGDPPLVLTNFHVLQQILRSPGVQYRLSGSRMAIYGGPGLDFDGEIDSPVRVTHKIAAARLPKGCGQTAGAIDAVALEIAPVDRSKPELPTPIQLSSDVALAGNTAAKLIVIGFPADPKSSSGVVDGVDWNWISSVLFGRRFGLKRAAPGLVRTAVSGLGADWHESVFAHDASTLGGSSGSIVFGLATGTRGMGLHFAGLTGQRNEAHAFGTIADALSGVGICIA